MYLFEVKKPADSKGEWDLYRTLATIPGAEAFRPSTRGGCPLVTRPAQAETAAQEWAHGPERGAGASCKRAAGRDEPAGFRDEIEARRACGRPPGRKFDAERLLLASALCAVAATQALAQTPVKIGVLNDRSGVYADIAGEGSVVAARMAVEDFKAAEKGLKVEIVAADHQNKPDVGASIAGNGTTATGSTRSSTCRPPRWRSPSTR